MVDALVMAGVFWWVDRGYQGAGGTVRVFLR